MNNKPLDPGLDAYEQEIEASLEAGEWHSLPPEEKERIGAILQNAAANYLKRDARINIRLSNSDLMRLKQRASREGLPYQTMIASILHKVASGFLDDRL